MTQLHNYSFTSILIALAASLQIRVPFMPPHIHVMTDGTPHTSFFLLFLVNPMLV